MIGQEKLVNELFSQPLLNTPKTMLFLGEYGCGKHTLVKELANHFSIEMIDITDNVSLETLDQIQLRSVPAFYIIDLDKLNERSQNVLLKSIEEPADNAYMVLMSSNENYILDTIKNRCRKYKFADYSKEELKSIIDEDVNEDMLSVCNTPGQIKLCMYNFNKLKTLCTTIVNKLDRASFSNALSIADKINYKDEYDKFDLNIFLKVLMQELYNSYKATGNDMTYKLYNIVCEQSSRLFDVRLNKEIFMQHLITVMWKTTKGV